MNELISKTLTLLLLSTWLHIIIESSACDRLVGHLAAHGYGSICTEEKLLATEEESRVDQAHTDSSRYEYKRVN